MLHDSSNSNRDVTCAQMHEKATVVKVATFVLGYTHQLLPCVRECTQHLCLCADSGRSMTNSSTLKKNPLQLHTGRTQIQVNRKRAVQNLLSSGHSDMHDQSLLTTPPSPTSRQLFSEGMNERGYNRTGEQHHLKIRKLWQTSYKKSNFQHTEVRCPPANKSTSGK